MKRGRNCTEQVNGKWSDNGELDSGTEERDVKPVVKRPIPPGGIPENKYFSLHSVDRVRLTNLNNQNYQSNPVGGNGNDGVGGSGTSGDGVNKVVLPADKPIIGDGVFAGPNWKLQGLICYTMGCENNFHMNLKLMPGNERQVRISLNFKECSKSPSSTEIVKDLQEYAVSIKMMGKDRSTVLVTASARKESPAEASWTCLNNRIENLCSLDLLKSADQLHTYKIPKSKGGNEFLSTGEFDTVELEVEIQVLFKVRPNSSVYLKPFACFQSFQPQNLFRKTDICSERLRDVVVGVSTSKKQSVASVSRNRSRYSEIVCLRLGPDQEELYVYKSDLTDSSPALQKSLNGSSILDMPTVTGDVMVLFLDLLDQQRTRITTGGPAPAFQNFTVKTVCETLKLMKDYQISLSKPVVDHMLSNVTHTVPSALQMYSWGLEFGIEELKQCSVNYLKEHKEELRQDPAKKLLEKMDRQILVSIFSFLL